MGVRHPDPLKISMGSEYVLPSKMSYPFIQNCCWITLQVSHHEGMKDAPKMEVKTNFSRCLKQFDGLT